MRPACLRRNGLIPTSTTTRRNVAHGDTPRVHLRRIHRVTRFLDHPPLRSPHTIIILRSTRAVTRKTTGNLLGALRRPKRTAVLLLTPNPRTLLPALISHYRAVPFRQLGRTSVTAILRHMKRTRILGRPRILTVTRNDPKRTVTICRRLRTVPPRLLRTLRRPPHDLHTTLRRNHRITGALSARSRL